MWGIEAGWGIVCKLKLSINLRIFAGLCIWRKPTNDEMIIKCGELEKGEICFGDLKEIGIDQKDNIDYEINGISYSKDTLRSIIKKANDIH